MDLTTAIAQIRAGDLNVFTDLVRHYQDLAFGYAFAMLHDFHLAQDVAQESFVCAFYDLPRLQEPAAFPGWLRGIVRHQCIRVIRRRHHPSVSLEYARELAASTVGPEQWAEEQDQRSTVLAAIDALPQEQREVIILFYIKEYTQQEVAAFLGLPVTTVNNRLHAARKRLKRRMLPMVKDTLNEHTLPDDFAANVGTIIQVQGPLIDARFAPDKLPPLLGTLTVAGSSGAAEQMVVVAQYLGDGIVRGIPMRPTSGIAQGTELINTGNPIDQALEEPLLRRAVATFSAARPNTGEQPVLLETGIKIIDLLAPCIQGGKVGIFGDMRSGKVVIANELAHNLAAQPSNALVMVFIHGQGEPARLQLDLPHNSGPLAAIYIPTDDPSDLGFAGSFSEFDTVLYNNRQIGLDGIWPAIDPRVSSSRTLDPAIVGQEHYELAQRVRALLQAEQSLGLDPEQASRVRKLRRYFSQPFHTAEAFTGRPGVFVPRKHMLRDCHAILAGKYDTTPEEEFVWRGSLEDSEN